jgi:hypothetical protein
MAYETASATSPNDLLDKLRVFALANGWTVDYYGGRTNPGGALQAGSNNALALNKAGAYFVLYTDTSSPSTDDPAPRIQSYMHTGPYVAASGTDAQANRYTYTRTNNLGGPYTAYHFFTDSTKTYLHVVVEVVSGRFAHFNLGIFDKAGGGSNALYCSGMHWNYNYLRINNVISDFHAVPFDCLYFTGISTSGGGTIVRADSDGISPRYYRVNNSQPTTEKAYGGARTTAEGFYSYGLVSRTASVQGLTNRAILAPAVIVANRLTDARRSIIGTPYDLRWCRLDALEPGEIVTIGSDNWKVFPVIRKMGAVGIENSSMLGYAYRIIS